MDHSPGTLRIAFVPGVTPDKWARIWRQRMSPAPLEVMPVPDADQVAVLHEGRAEMAFVRLPIDREGLHVIPLYREVPVVVVPVDHPVAAYDEIALADLTDENLIEVPPAGPEAAVTATARGTGIVVLPRSVARLHARRDVTSRPVTGVEESQVGLAWLTATTGPQVEAFIGIVRGRTERSSRG